VVAYDLMAGMPSVRPVDPGLARTYLRSFAAGGKSGVSFDDVEQAVDALVALRGMNHVQNLSLVALGFEYWLKKQKVYKALRDKTSMTGWSPEDVLAHAAGEMRAVSASGRKTLYGLREVLDEEEVIVDRKSSGIADLDGILGGGIGKKEHILFIAPTGAGKTVMACQLANALSLQGDKGLLVTTEQPRNELVERMVSANCDAQFSRIMQQGWRNLSKTEYELYEEWSRETDGRLFILEWMADRSRSVVEYMDSVIIEAKASIGGLDYLILDWIGGALGALVANQDKEIRRLYQNTADKMADIARDHDLRCISFAQAHPVYAANKKKVDQSTLQECKTMGNNATVILGITALLDESAGDDEVVYSDNQFLYCSKGRKAKNRHVRLRRDFAYQRFKPVG